ncbi:MAG: biopolymer transporter ExbD [Halobacteriovoraceae bacterium]|jgi:biopolymer transport protein ExbD|nr:biopolymer transporter ExbD [Halobacteriovoraceae bacterium]
MRKKTGLGQKKELDAQLNLTPFIDLLSTCVCFLLITAVWIEIGTVEVKQSHGTAAEQEKKETYDLDLVFKTSQEMTLNLKKNGKRVRSMKVKAETNEDALVQLNEMIVSKIRKFKNKTVEIATATVTPRSTVDYGNLISAMDVLRKNQIVNIGVLTASGN